MTESEYIDASNVRCLRNALAVLREVHHDALTNPERQQLARCFRDLDEVMESIRARIEPLGE